MAEARVEDEMEESLRETREAGGARRNPRTSNAASERADRNKPEQRPSSTQGALSSIRAVIKRTSNRTAAPIEQNRERRRPEITILAAEPLATNSWFPGSPGVFPPAPPPAQPSWTSSVTVQLPPPSYEQVIREKSREENTQPPSVSLSSSSPSPSSSLLPSSSSPTPRHTVTIATQTEPETSESETCTKPSMRRPPKPPRPAPPLTPKPAEPVLVHADSLIELGEPDPPCSTHTPTHPPSGELCGVQTNFTHALEPLTPISADSSHITHNSQSQTAEKQEVSARPRPRPRSRALMQPVIKEELQDQPVTREVKVQTLVRVQDDGTKSVFAGFTDTDLDLTSNKYLQDLLDVFGCDKQDVQSGQSEKSDEEEHVMFESCPVPPLASEPLETITRPEPRPRTPKLSIASKPCDPPQSMEETKTSSGQQTKPSVHPVPVPRPMVKKSSVPQQQGSTEEKTEPYRIRPPPRPPLAARRSGPPIQEPVEVSHNFSERTSGVPDSTIPASGKPVAIKPSSRGPDIPSSQRKPPPITHTPTKQDVVGAEIVSKSSPSVLRQATDGKLLPARPPPIKSSTSLDSSPAPAATNQHSGSKGVRRGPALPPRPQPGHPLYKTYKGKPPHGNTKVNPSSDPEESSPQKEKHLVVFDDVAGPTKPPGFPGGVMKGQRQDSMMEEAVSWKNLELKKEPQTEEQQPGMNTSGRYRARFAFQGEDGELTFRDGDIITLLEYVNKDWGRGTLNGRTGIFPLNFVQLIEESPATPETPVWVGGGGQTGRALFNFTPESEDELCLKVGDVVSCLEDVDEEWFVGEFAGRRGIVPKNYIQLF